MILCESSPVSLLRYRTAFVGGMGASDSETEESPGVKLLQGLSLGAYPTSAPPSPLTGYFPLKGEALCGIVEIGAKD